MSNSLLNHHLRSIIILRDLDESSIKAISHYFETKTYRAGQSILNELDDSHHVIALCEGSARVSLKAATNKQIHFKDIRKGELVGDWAAIDDLPRSANVHALTDCCVGFISQTNFLTLIQHNPTVAMRQMQELTKHLRAMNQKIADLVTMKATERIHKVLVEMGISGVEGLFIRGNLSHQEIAIWASTQREVVARELSKLQNMGLLIKRKDGYLLPDTEKLLHLGKKEC